MQPPPPELDGAKVLYFVVLNESHHRTGAVTHYVDGELLGIVPALAIAQYSNDCSVYLFHCDADWEVVQDDLLDSVEEAIQDAQRQYKNLEKSDFVSI